MGAFGDGGVGRGFGDNGPVFASKVAQPNASLHRVHDAQVGFADLPRYVQTAAKIQRKAR